MCNFRIIGKTWCRAVDFLPDRCLKESTGSLSVPFGARARVGYDVVAGDNDMLTLVRMSLEYEL